MGGGAAPESIPKDKTRWIGIWEQTVGASYALARARSVSLSKSRERAYHSKVRPRVVECLQAGQLHDVPGHWQANFYLNSAYQRVVWAEERYAAAIAQGRCSCGFSAAPKAHDVGSHHRAAKKTLAHLREAYGDSVTASVELLGQYKPGSAAGSDLMLLRNVVNSRKHGDYPNWDGNWPAVKEAAQLWEETAQTQRADTIEQLVRQMNNALDERVWRRLSS